MKPYATRFLKAVALSYMAYPVVYLVLAALLFDLPAKDCISILLSPSYYGLSLFAMAVGYGLWETKRWSWYFFIAFNFLVAYSTAVLVADRGTTHNKWWTFLFAVGLLVLMTWRVSRELRVPYFLPRIRWWESNPKYRLTVPVRMAHAEGTEWLDGDILDLSALGCFVKTRAGFPLHDAVKLQFRVFGLSFECQGNVVWLPISSVTHPRGLGIKFFGLSRVQRRGLRAVEKRLRKISGFYRASRYLMSPEEFSQRMAELNAVDLKQESSK